MKEPYAGDTRSINLCKKLVQVNLYKTLASRIWCKLLVQVFACLSPALSRKRAGIQVKWKTCTLPSSKFIQDTTHQILSKSAELYRRCDKEHFGLIFSDSPCRVMYFLQEGSSGSCGMSATVAPLLFTGVHGSHVSSRVTRSSLSLSRIRRSFLSN